jgi:hypothetical protein
MNNLFLFLLLVCAFSKDVSDRPREVLQKGDISCIGNINTKSINIESGLNFIVSNMDSGYITSPDIVTKKITVDEFYTNNLVPYNKDRILYVIFYNSD